MVDIFEAIRRCIRTYLIFLSDWGSNQKWMHSSLYRDTYNSSHSKPATDRLSCTQGHLMGALPPEEVQTCRGGYPAASHKRHQCRPPSNFVATCSNDKRHHYSTKFYRTKCLYQASADMWLYSTLAILTTNQCASLPNKLPQNQIKQ